MKTEETTTDKTSYDNHWCYIKIALKVKKHKV